MFPRIKGNNEMALITVGIYSSANTNFFPKPKSLPTCTFILRYKEQILVNIEKMEDGLWVARNSEIKTHGVGKTCEEALTDYQEMLIDYFNSLVVSENVLSANLLEQLMYLRTILPDDIIALG